MEPEGGSTGGIRSRFTTGHFEKSSVITQKPPYSIIYDNLNKASQSTEANKVCPQKFPGPDINKLGNAGCHNLASVSNPKSCQRRADLGSSVLLGTTNHNDHINEDFTLNSLAKVKNTDFQKASSNKRKPLYLPLPRKTSCKFVGVPDQGRSGGRPLWKLSVRIDDRSRSMNSVPTFPRGRARATSTPTKPTPLEISKPQSSPNKRESVFERLYKENGVQGGAVRQQPRSPLSAQSFVQPVSGSPAHSLNKNSDMDESRMAISSSRRSHRAHLLPSSPYKKHIERGSDPPQEKSRTESTLAPSILHLPTLKKGNVEESKDLLNTFDAARRTENWRDGGKTQSVTIGETLHLADSDVLTESLNELILQLADEHSISTTDTPMDENEISWKSLFKLLAGESVSSANIAKMKEIYEKLLSDRKNESHQESASRVNCCTTDVCLSLQDEDLESVIAFGESVVDAILVSHDREEPVSPRFTTVVDRTLNPVCQEISPSFNTHLVFSISPVKVESRHEGTRHTEYLGPNEQIMSTESPGQDMSSEGSGYDEDWGKSINLGSGKYQTVVATAALMHSCVGVIEPYEENNQITNATAISIIPTLSNKSSVEQNCESEDQNSYYEESFTSLNSTGEYLPLECEEMLKVGENTRKTEGPLDKCTLSEERCRHLPFYHQRNDDTRQIPGSNTEFQSTHFKHTALNVSNVKCESVTFGRRDIERMSKFGEAAACTHSSSDKRAEERQLLLVTGNLNDNTAADVELVVHPESERMGCGQSNLPLPSGPDISTSQEHCTDSQDDHGVRRATAEETAEVVRYREALSELNFRCRTEGTTTRKMVREIKMGYREIVLSLRSHLNTRKESICQDSMKALETTLLQFVDQFVNLVDDRIMHYSWLGAWDIGCLLRLKADFMRYLYEAYPDNINYRTKCHEAYKSARIFFLENGLQDKAEWVYLHMNYATFLYTIGDRKTAQFINEKLFNSFVVRQCGKEIKTRLRLNLQFYTKL